MKRTHLFYHPESESYLAGTHHDFDSELEDVTGNKEHERCAVLHGEWVGSNPLPRDLAMKGTEHGEQTALFAWAAAVKNAGICPHPAKMYATPNGAKRDKRTAAMLKAEGVKSGIPDVFLPVPTLAKPEKFNAFGSTTVTNGLICGLYIEMKKIKGGKLSDEQRERIEQLQADGYAAVVCKGWIEAKNVIITYLGLHC